MHDIRFVKTNFRAWNSLHLRTMNSAIRTSTASMRILSLDGCGLQRYQLQILTEILENLNLSSFTLSRNALDMMDTSDDVKFANALGNNANVFISTLICYIARDTRPEPFTDWRSADFKIAYLWKSKPQDDYFQYLWKRSIKFERIF